MLRWKAAAQDELASRLAAEAERRAVERRLRELEADSRKRSLATLALQTSAQRAGSRAMSTHEGALRPVRIRRGGLERKRVIRLVCFHRRARDRVQLSGLVARCRHDGLKDSRGSNHRPAGSPKIITITRSGDIFESLRPARSARAGHAPSMRTQAVLPQPAQPQSASARAQDSSPVVHTTVYQSPPLSAPQPAPPPDQHHPPQQPSLRVQQMQAAEAEQGRVAPDGLAYGSPALASLGPVHQVADDAASHVMMSRLTRGATPLKLPDRGSTPAPGGGPADTAPLPATPELFGWGAGLGAGLLQALGTNDLRPWQAASSDASRAAPPAHMLVQDGAPPAAGTGKDALVDRASLVATFQATPPPSTATRSDPALRAQAAHREAQTAQAHHHQQAPPPQHKDLSPAEVLLAYQDPQDPQVCCLPPPP